VGSVRKYQTSIRSLEKELQEMRYRLAQDRVGQLLHAARRVNDVRVLTSVVDRLDKASLRNLADELKSRIGRGVVVLATSDPDRVSLVAAITSNLTPGLHAGKMVKEIASLVGGGGGGRPDMAEAGGKDPSKLPLALEAVASYVEKHVPGPD
jgi:alanyl-tRNA synthetase